MNAGRCYDSTPRISRSGGRDSSAGSSTLTTIRGATWSTPDPWSAGLPDRLEPPELLAHNGPAGRTLYGDLCGDRRAWTWEVRFYRHLSWRSHLQVLHVGNAANERANDLADQIERETGYRPQVHSVPPDVRSDFFSLMEHSGELLRECISP